jgi:hypothetical protein
MTFWGGSGSGSTDPCLLLMDPDPDPAIFVIDLQDASKKLIFQHNVFCLLLFEATFTSFFKDKISKRVTKCSNQGFSYYFWMMIQKHVDPVDLDPDPQHWYAGRRQANQHRQN